MYTCKDIKNDPINLIGPAAGRYALTLNSDNNSVKFDNGNITKNFPKFPIDLKEVLQVPDGKEINTINGIKKVYTNEVLISCTADSNDTTINVTLKDLSLLHPSNLLANKDNINDIADQFVAFDFGDKVNPYTIDDGGNDEYDTGNEIHFYYPDNKNEKRYYAPDIERGYISINKALASWHGKLCIACSTDGNLGSDDETHYGEEDFQLTALDGTVYNGKLVWSDDKDNGTDKGDARVYRVVIAKDAIKSVEYNPSNDDDHCKFIWDTPQDNILFYQYWAYPDTLTTSTVDIAKKLVGPNNVK